MPTKESLKRKCDEDIQELATSSFDNIKEPVPGLVAGGAKKGQEDAEFLPAYASNIPDESDQDNVGSYASNEIAINWNAYLVSLLGWIN